MLYLGPAKLSPVSSLGERSMQFENPSPGNVAARDDRTRHDRMHPDQTHRRAGEISGGPSRLRGETPPFDADVGSVVSLGWASPSDWNSASGMPTIFMSDGFQHLSDAWL